MTTRDGDRFSPCYEELVKITIETSTDVKHILNSLKRFERNHDENEKRITKLEASEYERKGMEKGYAKSAAIVAGIISAIGALIAIGVNLIWRT